MRKVQSSVQLMERSRNPGVGYWSSTSNGIASSSTSAVPPPPSRTMSGVTSPDSVSMVGTPTRESRRSLESFDTKASQAPSTAAPSEAPKSSAGTDEEEVNLEVSLDPSSRLEAFEADAVDSISEMSSCSSWRIRR